MMYHRVTSGWLVLALAALYCPVIGADLSTGHGCNSKSIAQAYLECLQYLNIGRQSMYADDTAGANCLMRCIGLNTRWWDNDTGLNEPALLRFFRQVDASGLEKARACVEDQAVEQMDSCAAAYHTFRCYGDALGEVVAHAEYLVPRRDTIRQAVDDCAQILQVPDERLATCAATGSFLRVEDGTRLLRCIVTRLGLYADTTGVAVDRLKLLMDAGTSGLWTEQRAHDAKQCEQDLRELGADVCQVAAQSVQICYGRQAFEALWQVLKEQYGAGVESFETDGVEQVEGSNDVEQTEHNPTPKPRYRSLLIIAPEVYHFKVNSEQDSDSTSEETAQNEVKSVEQEPAGQPQATSTTEAPVRDEKQHVVHKRSMMYPMLSEHLPLYTPYRPQPVRFRRAVPLPHYHAAMMPMMNPRYCHAVVRRSIALDPMYQSFVPQRYVREVIPVMALDEPGPGELSAVQSEQEPLPQGMQMVPEDLVLVGEDSAQSDDAPVDDAPESNVLLAPEEPDTDDGEVGTPYEDPAVTGEANEVVTKSDPESTTELAAPTPTPDANTETETVVPKHPAKPLVPITGTKLLQALHLAQILSRMEVQPSGSTAK